MYIHGCSVTWLGERWRIRESGERNLKLRAHETINRNVSFSRARCTAQIQDTCSSFKTTSKIFGKIFFTGGFLSLIIDFENIRGARPIGKKIRFDGAR